MSRSYAKQFLSVKTTFLSTIYIRVSLCLLLLFSQIHHGWKILQRAGQLRCSSLLCWRTHHSCPAINIHAMLCCFGMRLHFTSLLSYHSTLQVSVSVLINFKMLSRNIQSPSLTCKHWKVKQPLHGHISLPFSGRSKVIYKFIMLCISLIQISQYDEFCMPNREKLHKLYSFGNKSTT